MNIISEALKELNNLKEDFDDDEDYEEDIDTEEWDENILEPAIKEIEAEKGIKLEYEGNGDFGEILTIWSNDPKVKWEESVYNFEDDDDEDWDEDEGELFNQLNMIDPEEDYSTKEELKEYILSMLVIKEDSEDLSEYALSKNCEGYEDLENYYSDEEIKGYIDDAYDCIFGGGYYNKEDTTFVLYEDYIEIFVNGKSEGKFEISYDSSVRAYRLYTYND